jgi:FMN-dependent NADH-azoreductase
MTTLLLLTCSPRGDASESKRLALRIVDRLVRANPEARLVTRALGPFSMPHVDANYALAQHWATAHIAADGSIARSEELIRELEAADAVVLATPMHNLGVPSALKAWIDHVVRARRTFTMSSAGKTGLLRDRPVYVAVAAGGRFSGTDARQPDFLTPYLRLILDTIGLHDVTFFCVEGTGAAAEAVMASRARADEQVDAHFAASCC